MASGTSSPLSSATTCASERMPTTSTPPAITASPTCGSGTTTRVTPRSRAASTIGSTPGTDRSPPDNVSSPMSTVSSSDSFGTTSSAPRTATAIARSKWVPRLGRSAGESRIVMRLVLGQSNRLLMIAIRHRSRASLRAGVRPSDQDGGDLSGRDVGLDVDQVARAPPSETQWEVANAIRRAPARGRRAPPRADRGARRPGRPASRSGGRRAPRPPPRPARAVVAACRRPLLRAATRRRRWSAGLDLAGDQHAPSRSDQVELALVAPPVAVEDDHPPVRQVGRRHPFAIGPSACRCAAVVVMSTSCEGGCTAAPSATPGLAANCGEVGSDLSWGDLPDHSISRTGSPSILAVHVVVSVGTPPGS